jgi:acyl dehydratase
LRWNGVSSLKSITLDELLANTGKEVGVSPWRVVTQTMIDQFANATDDHQFIHVDPERAAAETPFGGTIAHGFLSLSLLSAMTYETLPTLEGAGMGINYGFDKLRFIAPVKSGARIRARFFLADVNARPSGWVQITYNVTIDIENSTKPAITAKWLTLAVIERKEETA